MSFPFRQEAAASAVALFDGWGEAAVFAPLGGDPVECQAVEATADVVRLFPSRLRQTARTIDLLREIVPARPARGDTITIGDLRYTVREAAVSEDRLALVWVCAVGEPDSVHNRTATLAITLGAVTLAAAGEVDGDVTGALDGMLSPLTLAGAGAVDVSGALSVTLGAATLAAAGAVDIAGSLGATLAPLTLAADGEADVSGALAVTLGAATLSATGTVDVAGSLSATLGALALAADGEVDVAGALAATLGAATLSATGTVVATFDPSAFAVWIDPSDLSSVFQERTGASATTPSAVGDPVGSIANLGTAGGWCVAPSDAARPILRQTGGGKYYLEFDASNDMLDFPFATAGGAFIAVRFPSAPSSVAALLMSETLGLFANIEGAWGTYTGATVQAGTTLGATTDYVLGMHGGAAGTFRTNAGGDGSYSGSWGWTGFTCLGSGPHLGQPCASHVYGVIAHSSALDAGELAGAEAYLAGLF